MSSTGQHLTLSVSLHEQLTISSLFWRFYPEKYGDSARHVPLLRLSNTVWASISWGLTYNLYGDKLLKLDLFPESIYTLRQSSQFSSCRHLWRLSLGKKRPGIRQFHVRFCTPLRFHLVEKIPRTLWRPVRHSVRKLELFFELLEFDRISIAIHIRRQVLAYACAYHTSVLTLNPFVDWQTWTAAIVTDTAARDLFIGSVKKYAADGLSSQPFGDWYETTNGQPEGFRARPVVGGHLGASSFSGALFLPLFWWPSIISFGQWIVPSFFSRSDVNLGSSLFERWYWILSVSHER